MASQEKWAADPAGCLEYEYHCHNSKNFSETHLHGLMSKIHADNSAYDNWSCVPSWPRERLPRVVSASLTAVPQPPPLS